MMSTVPNSLPKPERFDLYVRKFRATCAMHGIQVGSRDDLPGFMQKLVEDRFFAMEFWKLIGRLSDRDGGELSDDQMLAVVVEGVTGGEISEEDAEGKKTVDDLRAMFAGVDVQGMGQNQVELAPFPPSGSESWQGGGASGIHAVEPSRRLADSREAFLAETMKEEAEPAPVSSESEFTDLDEEHLRRELSKLVERYLESVKKSKRKPVTEEEIAPEVVADAPMQHLAETSISEAADELTLTPTGSSRLVLEPDMATVEDSLATTRDRPSMRFPLEDYSSPAGYGKIVLYLVLALALLGAGFASYQNRASILHQMSLLRQDIQRKTGKATLAEENAPQTIAPEGESSPQSEPNLQPAAQPSSPVVLTSPSNAVASPRSKQTLSAGSQTPIGIGSTGDRNAANDRAMVQSGEQPASPISSADLAGTVQVSSDAMGAYLVVSRVPAYPDTAKADGIRGSVEMQVIIAKDGTVKRVHVIRGDPRLRVAAAEAVYKWKYRPYLVDGQPVEVASTITVDFDLNR